MTGAIPVFSAVVSSLCFNPSLAQTTLTTGIGDYVAHGIGQPQDPISSATTWSTRGSSALAPNSTRLYANSSSTCSATTATASSVTLTIEISSPISTTRIATSTFWGTLSTDSVTSNSSITSTDSVVHKSVSRHSADSSTTVLSSAALKITSSTSSNGPNAASSFYNGTMAQSTASAVNGSVAISTTLLSRPSVSDNHSSQYLIGPTSGLSTNGTSAGGLAANVTLQPIPDAIATSTGPQTVYNSSAPWAVASNGSGAAYASRCNAEWQSWYSLSDAANRPVSTYAYTSTYMVGSVLSATPALS